MKQSASTLFFFFLRTGCAWRTTNFYVMLTGRQEKENEEKPYLGERERAESDGRSGSYCCLLESILALPQACNV